MSYILYFLNLKINCINNHTPPRRKTSTDITVSISSAPSASKTAAVFILEDCVQKLRISRASVQLDGVLSLSLSFHVKSPSIFFWRKCTIKKSWKKIENNFYYISQCKILYILYRVRILFRLKYPFWYLTYIMTDRDIRSVQSSFKPTTSDVHVRVVIPVYKLLRWGKSKVL